VTARVEPELEEIGRPTELQPAPSLLDEVQLVLKHDDAFAVFDPIGDLRPGPGSPCGLYAHGTRHLAGLSLRIGGARPQFLGSRVTADGVEVVANLTNPPLRLASGPLARGTLHVQRRASLWRSTLAQRITVANHGLEPIRTPLTIEFTADFWDLFEVRGLARPRRGSHAEPISREAEAILRYEGLDAVTRQTRLRFSPSPTRLDGRLATFDLALDPGREVRLELSIACATAPATGDRAGAPGAQRVDFAACRRGSAAAARRVWQGSAEVSTTHPLFDRWLERSVADLGVLTSRTRHGLYPYAGIPWYSTPFGRDGLLTAFMTLWMNPEIARGVLRLLAANQATAVDTRRDAQPGKIVHELREGEMPALGEVPFGRYFGSQDATPLFVMLAAAHHRRTADVAFAAEMWPAVERALGWMDRYGDPDGDGFLEYRRLASGGLEQQGWKDSPDSVFHLDGTIAPAPVALVEVQAYAIAARRGAADLAAVLGHRRRERELRANARLLRRRFEEAFWDGALGSYVLALDGDKRPCRVRASNAGHVLWAGVAGSRHARQVTRSLLDPRSFSGFGLRTVAEGEARYNPLSYHDGSVWPHDTALAARGIAAYGARDAAMTVVDGLFAAARGFPDARLPELYCGFPREGGDPPVAYPVACSPQAWSAAVALQVVEIALGLELDALERVVRIRAPRLPAGVDDLRVSGVVVAGEELSIALHRDEGGVVPIVTGGRGLDVRIEA
jgi:glycogen debranching enzyme